MGQSVSSNCSIDRTFSITVYFSEKPAKLNKSRKTYRNPIIIAKEYNNMIKSGRVKSEADLGRELGVSRVRVNQFIRLLKLDSQIINFIEEFGDPLSSQVITERMLRPYIGLPFIEQQSILRKKYIENNTFSCLRQK